MMTQTTTAELGRCPYGRSYPGGCRCDVCKARSAAAARRYRRRLAQRAWGVTADTDRLDPTLTTETVRAVKASGITFLEMSRVTGIPPNRIRLFHVGELSYVTRATQEKILKHYGEGANTRRDFGEKQLLPASDGTWKLRALLAQGWRQADLRDMLEQNGMSSGFLNNIGRGDFWEYGTLKKINWLVEQIGDKPGPSHLNRVRLQNKGIYPLIHYTEDGKLIRGSLTKEQRARRVR